MFSTSAILIYALSCPAPAMLNSSNEPFTKAELEHIANAKCDKGDCLIGVMKTEDKELILFCG